MKQINRRNFSRIPMVRTAQLILPDNSRTALPVQDLSLAGMLLGGGTEYPLGIYCTIIFDEQLSTRSVSLVFTGKIVRKTDDTIAIQLIGTDQKTFDLLQTIILYESSDPVTFCEELTEDYNMHLYQDSDAVRQSMADGNYMS